MRLKSITVSDFRQFKGTQKVSFAVDPSRNVTVVVGGNGAGKTSFAQAFVWCLYGRTDFADPVLFCKASSEEMLPGASKTVSVAIELEHAGQEYAACRKQNFAKTFDGVLRDDSPVFSVTQKTRDGQTKAINGAPADLHIKEILPEELSKYFFFDGERIGNMSKEIRKGKSQEFAKAVKSLLGLEAIFEALEHIGIGKRGIGNKSVIRSYEEDFDPHSDQKIKDYARQIAKHNEEIDKVNARITEIDAEVAFAENEINKLEARIFQNKSSEEFAKTKERLVRNRDELTRQKDESTALLLKTFAAGSASFFSRHMMAKSIDALAKAEKVDKGIPDIQARTLDFLLERGKCICGCELREGSLPSKTLDSLRAYIPPQSIGTAIGEFTKECEMRVKFTDAFFAEVENKYSVLRRYATDFASNEADIFAVEEKLKRLDDVGALQTELSKIEAAVRRLKQERDSCIRGKGALETKKEGAETEKSEFSLKDKSNRKNEVFKAYAQFIFEQLKKSYEGEEAKVREKLENTINRIFQNIYNGGFSLSINENYDIRVNVIDRADYHNDVETSTAQSISIIFAFIAGVIELARENSYGKNAMLSAEAYPLVMDAPLSAFDRTRIGTICAELPKAAEQIVIFIKDTDGEIAETHLSARIGKRYKLKKNNEFVTTITEDF